LPQRLLAELTPETSAGAARDGLPAFLVRPEAAERFSYRSIVEDIRAAKRRIFGGVPRAPRTNASFEVGGTSIAPTLRLDFSIRDANARRELYASVNLDCEGGALIPA